MVGGPVGEEVGVSMSTMYLDFVFLIEGGCDNTVFELSDFRLLVYGGFSIGGRVPDCKSRSVSELLIVRTFYFRFAVICDRVPGIAC